MGEVVTTLILGVVIGSIYALAATGLVLTYRISGVLNFGFGSMAMLGAFLHWQLVAQWHWSAWASGAFVLLVVAPLIGVFLDTQLFRRIEGQPMVISIIATVGLVVLLQGVVILIWGTESHASPSLFPQHQFKLPLGIRLGSDELATLVLAAALAAVLALAFRYTRIGVAFRAVVDNRQVAGLMAINTGLVSSLAWAIGSSFAALTGILLGPTLFADTIFLPFFVISTVLGAAIVGYMRSLPLAYAGGIGLGVIQTLIQRYTTLTGVLSNLSRAIPFVTVVVAVLVAPRALRQGALGSSFVVRTRELGVRAPPRARAGVAAAVFAGLVLAPLVSPLSWKLSLTEGLTFAIVFLSLVVLTGYSGQISLGHAAFMGIGAFAAAHIGGHGGVWTWLAIPLGSLAAVPAGALIGMVAARLHGLFLALMTLGFGFVVYDLFFTDPRISGGFVGLDLPKPRGLEGDVAYYYLALAALGLFSLAAVNLRTGRTGRVLAAMRDSETASRALGINVFRYKRIIFGMSAFMAATGAILHGMIREHVSQNNFLPFLALFYVAIAVVGGIFHVGGAITAGVLFAVYPRLFAAGSLMNRLQFILFGLGATLALAQNPEGVFGELRRGAAFVLGVVRRARPTAPVPVAGGQE